MFLFNPKNYYKKCLVKFIRSISNINISKQTIDYEKFIDLLGGIYEIQTHTKWRGLATQDLPNIIAMKHELTVAYNIINTHTAGNKLYQITYKGIDNDYRQFLSFWKGHPLFDIRELNQRGYKMFASSKEFAYQFYELLGDIGFVGWDISEGIKVLRLSYICGYIKAEEAEHRLRELVDKADKNISSWQQYALSFLAGGAYASNKLFRDDKSTKASFDYFYKVIEKIFNPTIINNWSQYEWYEGDNTLSNKKMP